MFDHISDAIKISRTDLDRALKILNINAPVYTATRHGSTVTLGTRNGTFTVDLPASPSPGPPGEGSGVVHRQGEGRGEGKTGAKRPDPKPVISTDTLGPSRKKRPTKKTQS
jgi:hypothetical protein